MKWTVAAARQGGLSGQSNDCNRPSADDCAHGDAMPPTTEPRGRLTVWALYFEVVHAAPTSCDPGRSRWCSAAFLA